MSIYLDHAATTPMPEELRAVYLHALEVVGNPSSIHQAGQGARALLEQARAELAEHLGADPMEVIFTSGGTEATNMWLKGRVFAHRKTNPLSDPCYLVLTRAEHHATLDAVAWLEELGLATPLWVDVDSDGVMDLSHLTTVLEGVESRLVAGLTSLVANNEVGSVQPVEAIAELARSRENIPVHLDAVQAFGRIPLNVRSLGVDAVSISGHKLGAPVGVGALFLSRIARPIDPLIHGGQQQPSRSGTLDAAGAVVLARAASRAMEHKEAECHRLTALRDDLAQRLSDAAPGVVVRGSMTKRLCSNVHVTVEGAEGEVMLYLLDSLGIHVSTGSACQAGVAEASHVLLAMGLSERTARSALRFTLGEDTTKADIDRVVEVFPGVVDKARAAGYSGD